jgi:hypothetical protein
MPNCGRCSYCRLECQGLGNQSLKGSKQSYKQTRKLVSSQDASRYLSVSLHGFVKDVWRGLLAH